MSQAENPNVPVEVRNELVHAYCQLIAEGIGVDLLHIKGAAVHPTLRRGDRQSLDADILVRPSHVNTLVKELRLRGWQKVTGFEEGSAFGHAMNLRHDLGMIDLHRRWPGFGISPESAFSKLWSTRESTMLGGIECPTPDVAGQRLVLLLHFGRSGGHRQEDLTATWGEASEAQRREVRGLVSSFGAEVALAAALGELDAFKSAPDYHLWKYFASGPGNRLAEWRGRWSAARTFRARLHVLRAFLLVNDDLLRAQLGHDAGLRERWAAQAQRLATAVRELRSYAKFRGGRS